MGANIRKHWNDPVCIQRVLFILVITLIGTFIYAAGLNIFLVPHHFLAGGVTGIAMILYYLMDIPIGLSNLVLNIPVLILSLRFMGKFYTVITILSTVSLSLFIDLTAFMADWCVISNPLVAAISGGVVLGAALDFSTATIQTAEASTSLARLSKNFTIWKSATSSSA